MKKYLSTSLAVIMLLLTPATISLASATTVGIQVLPNPTPPNAPIAISGGPFPSNDAVTIKITNSNNVQFGPTLTTTSNSNGGISTNSPAPSATGTYTVTASDASGNTGTATLNVEDPTSIAVILNPTSVNAGGQTLVTATIADPMTPTNVPTGSTTFSDGSAGSSFGTVSCTPSGNSLVCSATYTAPAAGGTVTITGNYGGDTTHMSSSNNAQLTVTSATSSSPTVTGTVTIVQTCGINPSGTLNYGNLSPGATSTTQSLTLQNTGTTSTTILVSGTDWTSQSGTPTGSIIPVGDTSWELSGGSSFTSLSSASASLVSGLSSGASQGTSWELSVPTVTTDPTIGTLPSGTILQQTVTFTTSC